MTYVLIGGIGLSMVGSDLKLEDEFMFTEAMNIGEYGSELPYHEKLLKEMESCSVKLYLLTWIT